MNNSTPARSAAKLLRIADPATIPAPIAMHKVRPPRGPARQACWPETETDNWETRVSLLWLASQLPILGVLWGLSLLGHAADAWHHRK